MNTLLRSIVHFTALSLFLVTIAIKGSAQTNAYPYKVAQDRMLWHDNVDKEQQRLVILGGGK